MNYDDVRIMIMLWLLTAIIVAFILGVKTAGGSGSGDYRITYYGDSFAGNPMFCTGEPYDPSDLTVVATASGGFPCGTSLLVCTDRCINMIVQDRCGGCNGQHVDVSESAWKVLGERDYGTVELLVEALKLPETGVQQ